MYELKCSLEQLHVTKYNVIGIKFLRADLGQKCWKISKTHYLFFHGIKQLKWFFTNSN